MFVGGRFMFGSGKWSESTPLLGQVLRANIMYICKMYDLCCYIHGDVIECSHILTSAILLYIHACSYVEYTSELENTIGLSFSQES